MASIKPDTNNSIVATGDPSETHGNEVATAYQYLNGWALTSLALALMFGSFMLVLDNTILGRLILHGGKNMANYDYSYLAQMSLLPTCRRIYTFYNIKWAYIVLLLIFELGSIVCAVAPNSTTLIVGRAIAGLGAAGLLSGATVILSYCVALKQRAFLLSIILGVYGVGSITRPLIGGAITDNESLGWWFIFWVNLPFGAVGLAHIWFTLRNPPPPPKAGLSQMQKIRQMDIPGAMLLIESITSLLLALQWGGIVYSWSDTKVFGTLIGFVLILTVFLVLQKRDQTNCTIPLHIFRSRTVCAACGFVLFVYARDSGIFTLPLAISNTLATLGTGWLTSKIGYYVPFMWIGAPLLATGGGLYQLIRTHSSAGEWIGYQIISGIGYGMCNQMAILAVQVVLDKSDVPTGCVMVIFFQGLGGVLATSIGQNPFTDKLIKELHQIDGVDSAAVVSAGARNFRSAIPVELIEPVIEAFNFALRNVFLVTLAAPLVSLVINTATERRRLSQDRKPEGTEREAPLVPQV
ncbi:major facilitator superfamily domain-containing protein [Xylaria sp. FL0064]|nr:major facilitator superfamily domain-containing protein [Xylaria sp. FL0064]